MAVNSPQEAFVFMLSNVRQGAERATKVFRGIEPSCARPGC